MRRLPVDWRERRYVEPFVGAASLFFRTAPKIAILSDANQHLISCYRAVRDSPNAVARKLAELCSAHSEARYYDVRDEYNGLGEGAAQAARFIYLNHSCYNGVFRVNTRGQFNVPYGRDPNGSRPTPTSLRESSSVLKETTLRCEDFESTLKRARPTDFIYLDPPYPPLNGTAYFQHYTAVRFSREDQERVAVAAIQLAELGAMVMISNADLPWIRHLYRGFNIQSIVVTRFVTSSATKHPVRELIITNY